jgi:catechol 2,3-dioxygenase-like lactoylglutathione lyase family enzyme
MAIIGAHMLLYSSEPDALRATVRDAFGFRSVDAGGGWLIFALPPSELAVHPADGPDSEAGPRHQISFMCDDIKATIKELRAKGVTIEGEPADQRWGRNIMMTLPGGVTAMLYQPRHAMAIEGASRDQPTSSPPG